MNNKRSLKCLSQLQLICILFEKLPFISPCTSKLISIYIGSIKCLPYMYYSNINRNLSCPLTIRYFSFTYFYYFLYVPYNELLPSVLFVFVLFVLVFDLKDISTIDPPVTVSVNEFTGNENYRRQCHCESQIDI